MRMMIVDDSNIVRSRISRLIEDPRLSNMSLVGTASNGIEAIKLFNETSPDIVTMDLTMPGIDGVECTEALIDLNPDTRILVISALSDKATAINALKKGAQGFLYKPFSDDEIIEALLEISAE
jgi:two-component system chemotaxis response regulator CheY